MAIKCIANGWQATRGCGQEGGIDYRDVDGSTIRQCPVSVLEESGLVEVWRAYVENEAHGIYPNRGGRWEQSATLVDLFDEMQAATSADGSASGKQE